MALYDLHHLTCFQTWKHRRAASQKHKDLLRFTEILEVLGWDGVSGDESETEGHETRYVIYPYEWRNPEIIPWIRIFDVVHEVSMRNTFNERGRGNSARTRVATTLKDVTRRGKVIIGLPSNFYNPVWLRTLSEAEQEDLEAQEPMDLVHTAAIEA